MLELNNKKFEDIADAFSDKSSMNFVQIYSVNKNGSEDTLSSFLKYLTYVRTVKGQNFKSLYTVEEINESGAILPDSTLLFYNKNGEKCCDLAQIPSSIFPNENLHYEDTVDDALEDMRSNGIKISDGMLHGAINEETFKKMNTSLASHFGINMDTTKDKDGYKPNRLRSLGKKTYKFLIRKSNDVDISGTLNFSAPKFSMQEGTPERAIEETKYYLDCVSKFVDLLADNTTKLNSSDYFNALKQSETFQSLNKEEQKKVLDKNKEAFESCENLLNQIAKDLVASEIVKLMPDMPAKQRYILNQQYLLRVARNIASLPESMKNNSPALALIRNSTREPVFRFAKQCRYTPEDVATLYAQVLQYPSKENYDKAQNAKSRYEKNEAIFQLICGSSEQILVSKAPLYVSKQEIPAQVIQEISQTAYKDNQTQANQTTQDFETVEENDAPIIITPVPNASENNANAFGATAKQDESSQASTLSPNQMTLDGFNVKVEPASENVDKQDNALDNDLELDVDAVSEYAGDNTSVVNSNQSERRDIHDIFKGIELVTSERDVMTATGIMGEDVNSFNEVIKNIHENSTPMGADEKKDEREYIGPASAEYVVKHKSGKKAKDFVEEHDKPVIKKEEIDLFPTHTPPMVAINLNEKSEEEIEKLVHDYVAKRSRSAIAHIAYYSNNGKNADPNLTSSKFLVVLNNYNEGKLEKDDELYSKAKMIKTAIDSDIDRVVHQIMQNWHISKQKAETNPDYAQWREQSTTIPKFINLWYNTINERELFDSPNKTFRGCYEAYVRKHITGYAYNLDKQNQVNFGQEM